MKTTSATLLIAALSALAVGQVQAQGSGSPGGGGITDPGAGGSGLDAGAAGSTSTHAELTKEAGRNVTSQNMPKGNGTADGSRSSVSELNRNAAAGRNVTPSNTPAGAPTSSVSESARASTSGARTRITPPAAGAPKSSLSPDANTPRANADGGTLAGTVGAYSATQAGTAPPPANAGALNPNKGGKTVTLNPGVPN